MFWGVLPEYLTYGMSVDEFWHGNVWLAESYRKAHEIKLQEMNNQAWLQGLYVYNAVGTIAAKLTSNRQIEYMDRPIDIFAPKSYEEERETARQEAAFKFLEGMMIAANERNKNGGQH